MWTTSYTVPNDLRNSKKAESFASALNIGTDIWIFCSHKQPQQPFSTEIWVFNIDTCKYRKINFKAPENFGHYFIATKKVDDHIYVWRAYEGRGENMLFRLDTNTCTFSDILTITAENCNINVECVVIEDRMYAWELEYGGDETEGVIYMHTINLDAKKVESKQLLKNVRLFEDTLDIQLMANNDELYLYESVVGMNRIIYRIINGQLTIVCEDQLNNGEDGFVRMSLWNESGVLYKDIHEVATTIYRDTFDFSARKWTRAISFEPFSYRHILSMIGSCDINGNIYVVTDRSHTKEIGYDIRVFEKVPRLESSCLMAVVDEYMKNKNDDMVERVKNLIPITMKIQLDNMIRWRVLKELGI